MDLYKQGRPSLWGNVAFPLFQIPPISEFFSDSMENLPNFTISNKNDSIFIHQNFWWPFLAIDSISPYFCCITKYVPHHVFVLWVHFCVKKGQKTWFPLVKSIILHFGKNLGCQMWSEICQKCPMPKYAPQKYICQNMPEICPQKICQKNMSEICQKICQKYAKSAGNELAFGASQTPLGSLQHSPYLLAGRVGV